jgi:hypothetical protein
MRQTAKFKRTQNRGNVIFDCGFNEKSLHLGRLEESKYRCVLEHQPDKLSREYRMVSLDVMSFNKY